MLKKNIIKLLNNEFEDNKRFRDICYDKLLHCKNDEEYFRAFPLYSYHETVCITIKRILDKINNN